ncbi:DUF3850 domain-containing protein [Bradyrhizobium paxllaeri]|uniref:DUF3850 domain-containing protein n=1 Tax=Bradyrhizobium paxllaeri TaxID=190148 RepID=UPI000810E6AE|nr:DUF3850 domain-containing protein [Bradyrhizobium paxllaeri]
MTGNAAPLDRVHHVKCWRVFFDDMQTGRKSFDVRRDDRDYQIGDIMNFKEWAPAETRYTGRETRKLITYIVHAGEGSFAPLAGLKPGFCVLGLVEVPEV